METLLHRQRLSRFERAGLYFVTSCSASAGRSTEEVVARALAGGVRLVQLREKDLSARALLSLARRLREMTKEAEALLIINDRLDVALAAGADGVHLGQDDLPVEEARKLAPDLLIGISAGSLEEALQAARAGASYVSFGPVFPTGTKPDAGTPLGIATVVEWARKAGLPFTVIGGICKQHIPELVAAGVSHIAVISAIAGAADPEREARDMLAVLRGEAGHHRNDKTFKA
ncbi:MAG: thiamine phosphate synthase [Kiritimatiellae bacterium]|nr:thiamine phosphate synthase [Kiritimatiellia bacterium]